MHAMPQRDFREARTSFPVRDVVKSWMVGLEVDTRVEGSIRNEIEFGYVSGKPMHLVWTNKHDMPIRCSLGSGRREYVDDGHGRVNRRVTRERERRRS